MDRFNSLESTDSFDHSDSEFDCSGGVCALSDNSLPFDVPSIENIILTLGDHFDLKVIMGNDRVKTALMVTSGLALAGGLIGNHYGGKLGAAVGTAVGGVCGIGVVAISMRDLWEEIKSKLFTVFELVYDYLAGLGIQDYRQAAQFLMQNNHSTNELVMVMVQIMTDILGKQVVSSIESSSGAMSMTA